MRNDDGAVQEVMYTQHSRPVHTGLVLAATTGWPKVEARARTVTPSKVVSPPSAISEVVLQPSASTMVSRILHTTELSVTSAGPLVV